MKFRHPDNKTFDWQFFHAFDTAVRRVPVYHIRIYGFKRKLLK